jgi:hypothetical protein
MAVGIRNSKLNLIGESTNSIETLKVCVRRAHLSELYDTLLLLLIHLLILILFAVKTAATRTMAIRTNPTEEVMKKEEDDEDV